MSIAIVTVKHKIIPFEEEIQSSSFGITPTTFKAKSLLWRGKKSINHENKDSLTKEAQDNFRTCQDI